MPRQKTAASRLLLSARHGSENKIQPLAESMKPTSSCLAPPLRCYFSCTLAADPGQRRRPEDAQTPLPAAAIPVHFRPRYPGLASKLAHHSLQSLLYGLEPASACTYTRIALCPAFSLPCHTHRTSYRSVTGPPRHLCYLQMLNGCQHHAHLIVTHHSPTGTVATWPSSQLAWQPTHPNPLTPPDTVPTPTIPATSHHAHF